MRRVPRWFAVLAVVASAVLVCAFTLRHAFAPPVLELKVTHTQLPADGRSSTELRVRSGNRSDLRDLKIESDGQVVVETLVVTGDSAIAMLRPGIEPGTHTVRVRAAGLQPSEVGLKTTLAADDSYADGTPDFLRLDEPSDRAAFRRWFTLLAESQYRQQAPVTEINDCAALVRFSYRESLRKHDSAWLAQMDLPAGPAGSVVSKYSYPYTPLGGALFRVREGSFAAEDVKDGAFAEFADAKTLWRYNTHFVARDIAQAKPGDLLFFRQSGHDLPFHAMVFVGQSRIEPGPEQYVVYHTGPEGKWKGEVRRPSVTELLNHPDARWHPVASNPAFLGVYRWNILRGEE